MRPRWSGSVSVGVGGDDLGHAADQLGRVEPGLAQLVEAGGGGYGLPLRDELLRRHTRSDSFQTLGVEHRKVLWSKPGLISGRAMAGAGLLALGFPLLREDGPLQPAI